MVEKSSKPFKSGFSLIQPEEIELDTQYTLTINIADLHGQFDIDHNRLYVYVQKYIRRKGIEFRLYPEYSKKGRLHLHGIITFKTGNAIMDFYASVMEQTYKSMMEIDTIEDIQTWSEYITKQEKYMRPYCEKKRTIYEFTQDSVNYPETPKHKRSIERWFPPEPEA